MNGEDVEGGVAEDTEEADAIEPFVGPDLSGDEGHMVLDELEDFIDDLEPGAAAEDGAVREEMERLLASLQGLEVPITGGSATPELIASWTRVLGVEGAHEEQGGAEEIRALIHEDLAALRDLLNRMNA